MEETEDLGVDRSGTGDRNPEVAAENVADLGKDLLVGEVVLLLQQEAGLFAFLFQLPDPLADLDSPAEDCSLEATFGFG